MNIYLKLLVCASLVFLGACGKKVETAKKASAALNDAQILYDNGQFKLARVKIESAIKDAPNLSGAHLLAGEISEKLGDFQTALREYIAADATGPGTEKARLAAASLLLRGRAYKLADEWIAKCLADRPNHKAMKAYRALLRERLGDSRNARADAEAVLAEDRRDVVANAVLAEEALRRSDPADALIKIEAGLSTNSSDKALLQLKAQAFLQQGAPQKAIGIYTALVAVDPTEPDFRIALAELLAKSVDASQGEKVLRSGVEAAPSSIEMRMHLVAFLARYRDRSAIIGELLSFIANSPETTAYDIALADVYAQYNEFDAATKVLNAAINRTRSGSAYAAAQRALARLLVSHGDASTARTILDNILKANPVDEEALAVHGQLMLKDKNPAGAISDFLLVVARQPANPAAFISLADAYLQNDQRKEAVAALKRALSIRSSDIGILSKIVDIQSGFGERTEASRSVDEFLERNPDSIDGLAMRIGLAIQSKDSTAAAVALARLKRVPRSDQTAVRLDAEIKEMRGQFSEAAEIYRWLLASAKSGELPLSAAQAFARTSIAAGQASQSVEILEQSFGKFSSDNMESYRLILAGLFDSLGQIEKARSLVEGIIQSSPLSPAPYLQQAALLARRKETVEALAFLNRGIGAGVPKEPMLLAAAQINSSAGQIENAIAIYRELLNANPNSIVGTNELVNLLADQTPLDKVALRQVRDHLQKLVSVKSPAILDTLAWSDYRLAEFARAKELLTLANAEKSTIPQIRYHYGAVLIALGDKARGQKIIRTTLDETYPGKDEALTMLKVED